MINEILIKNIMSEILFENRICESVEDYHMLDYIYNKLYESQLFERLLYGEPVNINELRSLLRRKIVNFEFIKLDGKKRKAKGTLLMKYVPQDQHPKGVRHSSPKVATFYDLQKKDWRSVSEKSKEIVLTKDEETQKPVVVVKDKSKTSDIAVHDEEPEEEPIGTIDGKSPEEPLEEPIEKKPEVTRVKPIEVGDKEKRFYFKNPRTGASMFGDMSTKDVIKKLKELGKDWELSDEKDFKEHEEEIEDKTEETPKIEEPEETQEEPEDIINKYKDKDLDDIEADEII